MHPHPHLGESAIGDPSLSLWNAGPSSLSVQVTATAHSVHQGAGGPSGSGAPQGLQQPASLHHSAAQKGQLVPMTRTAMVPCVSSVPSTDLGRLVNTVTGREGRGQGGSGVWRQASRPCFMPTPRSGLHAEKHFLDPAKRQGEKRGEGGGGGGEEAKEIAQCSSRKLWDTNQRQAQTPSLDPRGYDKPASRAISKAACPPAPREDPAAPSEFPPRLDHQAAGTTDDLGDLPTCIRGGPAAGGGPLQPRNTTG